MTRERAPPSRPAPNPVPSTHNQTARWAGFGLYLIHSPSPCMRKCTASRMYSPFRPLDPLVDIYTDCAMSWIQSPSYPRAAQPELHLRQNAAPFSPARPTCRHVYRLRDELDSVSILPAQPTCRRVYRPRDKLDSVSILYTLRPNGNVRRTGCELHFARSTTCQHVIRMRDGLDSVSILPTRRANGIACWAGYSPLFARSFHISIQIFG